ncbi:MAG: class I SAM-dependent methyltransferase [Desulfobacterota bacterium]|nr:class I SAM-dependent methyltransferase [Thermodesulfobacteriota bacterium]
MIHGNGWSNYCIWEHSTTVRELYARRCRREEEEMTCHAQAAELLAPYVKPGDTVLDVGCGSGAFYHSLKRRGLPVEYYGIDAAPSLIAIGRQYLPAYGLAPERLRVMRIEDMDGAVDHVVCLNVLSNIDNYHRPLERMLLCARKMVILRESFGDTTSYAYVHDKYLDNGLPLKVYVNTYCRAEVIRFIESYGFSVRQETDWRTNGQSEMVIDYPHYWCFLVAVRQ